MQCQYVSGQSTNQQPAAVKYKYTCKLLTAAQSAQCTHYRQYNAGNITAAASIRFATDSESHAFYVAFQGMRHLDPLHQ